MRFSPTLLSIAIFTILFVKDLNAQTDIWELSKEHKNKYSLLIMYNISTLDTMNLIINGVTIINNLTIKSNDTVNCKVHDKSNPIYYSLDANSIPHFFSIVNGYYRIEYVILFINRHKIKICNILDSSEKYMNFPKSGDCCSYEVEVILNGNRYSSIINRDKRFCYLQFFNENGRRSVRIIHRSKFLGLE